MLVAVGDLGSFHSVSLTKLNAAEGPLAEKVPALQIPVALPIPTRAALRLQILAATAGKQGSVCSWPAKVFRSLDSDYEYTVRILSHFKPFLWPDGLNGSRV